MVFTGLVLYLAFISSEIGKLFFDNLFLYNVWITTLKFTLITFVRSLVKMKKYVTGARASMHFKIGSHAKNG